MNRRDALTWIFGAAAAPIIESADVNVLPKETGGPLLLVITLPQDCLPPNQDQMKHIHDKMTALVPSVPVAILAPGMRLEAIYRTPPAKIHERIGEYEITKWYDPALGDWVVADSNKIGSA